MHGAASPSRAAPEGYGADAARGPALPTVDLLGFSFHEVTEARCVEHILGELSRGRGGWVVTPNLDIVRMMAASPALGRSFRRADLRVADGMPIVWTSRILGRPLPERVAGSSLISSLCEGAAREGRSVYLLGGDPGAADGAAAELRRRFPALRVAGTDCPARHFESDAEATAALERRLRDAAPDVVFVGLGCPKQERLIERLRSIAPGAWYLGIGISFSYLSGTVRRAPRWMRRCGLEWTYRLAQEPRRLARRYLRDDVPFAIRLGSLAVASRLLALAGLERHAPRLVRRS